MKHKSAQLQHKSFAFDVKASTDSKDGRFGGLGSVFGNVDSYREIVAAGAFAESVERIKASGDPLVALWQHNREQPIGGFDVLQETDVGLEVEGFLMTEEIVLAREAHALIKRRVVKGMSIGYYVQADSYDEKTGIRTLTKLDLQEISIVTFPANEEALIDQVKQKLAEGSLPTLREFERTLREQGYSKSQAELIAAHGFKKLQGLGDPGGGEVSALRKAIAALS